MEGPPFIIYIFSFKTYFAASWTCIKYDKITHFHKEIWPQSVIYLHV